MSTEWNGEGLPAIGLRVRIPDDMACGNDFLKQFEGMVVDIVGHTENHAGVPLAVFKYGDVHNPRYHALCGDNGNFEPIRTPEQIAAEEREKAIGEMFNAIHPGDRQVAIVNGFYAEIKKHLGDIYDAGYRKVIP